MGPRQRIALVALPVLVVFTSFAPVFIAGRASTEYLTWSIDCGSDRNYTDDATGIPWVTDEPFIQTGKSARNVTIYPSIYAYVNKEQLRTLRYFDDSRERHCYVLPVKPRSTYLLRTVFFLGNLTNSTKSDIFNFRIYINATRWSSLSYDDPDPEYRSEYNETVYREAIIYSAGAVLNICLLKSTTAVAFISTLELREFRSGMYSSAAAGGYQYQSFSDRLNVGAPHAVGDEDPLPYLRYPDDPYDRLWWAPGPWGAEVPEVNNTRRSSSSVQLQNRPPDKVMDDAWMRDDNETLYYISYNYTDPVGPIITYSYVMEFEENTSDSRVTGIEYAVNDILIDTFNASSVPQQIVSSITVPVNYYNMTFTPINKTAPAVLNALEVYFLYDMDTSFTAIADVNAITNVKNSYGLMDWSGDPCLPSSYDWLNCTLFQDTHRSDSTTSNRYPLYEYRITGLSLLNVTTRATERNALQEIPYLTNLTYLNLSGNDLSGSLINLSSIANLTVLDISNNNFDGEIVEFVRSIDIGHVQELYMSGNHFSSFSSTPSSLLSSNLTKLDVSKNRIGGDVMDFLVSIGEHSITELYAANNLLEGQLSASQLTAKFPNIQIVDFDGQDIHGTLDLSNWNLHNMLTQQVKLRNNNIDGVFPALDVLSWMIKDANDLFWNTYLERGSVDAYRGGAILLSGNPWCWATDSKFLAQRYLCRNDSAEFVNYNDVGVARPNSDKTNWAEIVGISVGAFVLVLCCIICFAIMLRNLRRKSRALAEVQGVLTRQNVHPPLYAYAELRTATKNFSYINNLGQGAFGAVYKGTLVDGTQVAVKRLFKDRQVLAEFLNEAVLITGIKHRNLAQLKGCCIDQDQRILVYEYAENGNLAEALWGQYGREREHRAEEPMSWKRRLNICVGIARGLSYLHEELQPRIIHRDIKPANILIDGNFNAKIADFGLARPFLEEQTQADYTNVAGTLGYLAPEYVTQGHLTEKADVYSCGVVLLEIVSGRKCIDQNLPPEKVSLIHWADTLRREGNVIDILDSSIQSSFNEEVVRVIDIAFSCLHTKPSQRPTMSQVVTMLQGNASSFNSLQADINSSYGPIGETIGRRIRLARTLSLGSGSYLLDSPDYLNVALDHTRNHSLELSSMSGR